MDTLSDLLGASDRKKKKEAEDVAEQFRQDEIRSKRIAQMKIVEARKRKERNEAKDATMKLMSEEIRDLKEAMEKRERKLEESHKNYEKLEASYSKQVEAAGKKCAQMSSQILNLKHQHEDEERQTKKSRTSAEQELERTKLELENASLLSDSKYSAIKSEKRELEMKNADLEHELAQIREQNRYGIDKIKTQFEKKLIKQKAEFEEQRKQHSEQILALRQMLDDQANEKKSDISRLKSQQLQGERAFNERLGEARATHKEREEELRKQVKDANDRCLAIQERMNSSVQSLNGKLATQRNEHSTQRTDLRKQMMELQKKYEQSEFNAKKTISEAQSKIEEYEKKCKDLQLELEDAENRMNEAADTITRYDEQLQEANTRSSDFQRLANQQTTQNKKLQELIQRQKEINDQQVGKLQEEKEQAMEDLLAVQKLREEDAIENAARERRAISEDQAESQAESQVSGSETTEDAEEEFEEIVEVTDEEVDDDVEELEMEEHEVEDQEVEKQEVEEQEVQEVEEVEEEEEPERHLPIEPSVENVTLDLSEVKDSLSPVPMRHNAISPPAALNMDVDSDVDMAPSAPPSTPMVANFSAPQTSMTTAEQAAFALEDIREESSPPHSRSHSSGSQSSTPSVRQEAESTATAAQISSSAVTPMIGVVFPRRQSSEQSRSSVDSDLPPLEKVEELPKLDKLSKQEAVTQPDSGLPDGWEQCNDSTGRVFFKNHITKTTQWEHPVVGDKPKGHVGETSRDTVSELCDYYQSGTQFHPMKIYYCYTCNWTPQNKSALCRACIEYCHAGHEIAEGGKSPAYCDCGSGGGCQIMEPKKLRSVSYESTKSTTSTASSTASESRRHKAPPPPAGRPRVSSRGGYRSAEPSSETRRKVETANNGTQTDISSEYSVQLQLDEERQEKHELVNEYEQQIQQLNDQAYMIAENMRVKGQEIQMNLNHDRNAFVDQENSLKSEIKKLNDIVFKYTTHYQEAEKQTIELKEQLMKAISENKQKTALIEKLKVDTTESQEQCELLNTQNQILKEQVETLTRKVQSLNDYVNTANRTVQDQKDEIAHLLELNKALHEKILRRNITGYVSENHDSVNGSRENFDETTKELQKSLAKLKQHKKLLVAEVKGLRQTAAEWKEKYEELMEKYEMP